LKQTECISIFSVLQSVADKYRYIFVSPIFPPKSAKSREIHQKIRTYSSLRLSKVIVLGANRKRIYNFLSFLFLKLFSTYWRVFSPPHRYFDASSGRTFMQQYEWNLYVAEKHI